MRPVSWLVGWCVVLACRVGADVAILLSGSGIVGQQNYQLMMDFARQLVYGLNLNRKDSQVAVVVFADDAQVRFYLNDFNNYNLPLSTTYPNDFVYAQIHALNAISNDYPYAHAVSQCANAKSSLCYPSRWLQISKQSAFCYSTRPALAFMRPWCELILLL